MLVLIIIIGINFIFIFFYDAFMKVKIFSIFILWVFIMICLGLFYLRHIHGEKIVDETRTVFIKKTDSGFQLFRNGKPFYLKGAAGDSHFKELAEIGGNTIRLYDTINLQSNLDEALKYGLAVIVDIPIPSFRHSNITYKNEEYNKALKLKIKGLVKKHKIHPALLMWNLGNELNYPIVIWENKFVNTFNDIVDIIHLEDPNHPISTAIFRKSEAFGIYLHSPKLDLISFNIFGDLKNLISKLSYVFFLTKRMPYYISEWGHNGNWEQKSTSWAAPIEPCSTKKCEQIEDRYTTNIATNNQLMGNLAFYWGIKLETTHTWFSLFRENYKSEIIKELENIWKKTNTKPSLIGLDYMLLEGKGASDNIVFSTNEIKSAELKFHGLQKEDNLIEWEIYHEAWDGKKTRIDPELYKPIENFINKSDKNKVEFITPSQEGPYRIFAYVYDNNGYFASTNTPFYVLHPK